MRSYKQLSYEERVKIAQLRLSSLSIKRIALKIGRSKSTISRELKRNSQEGYWPDSAQRKTLERRRRGCILDKDSYLKEFVMDKLQCHFWTPEQISGYLRHRQKKLRSISHETIYSWIYTKAQKQEKLWKFLPRHKAKRGLRKSVNAGLSRIPNRVSIHDRPKIIEHKKTFGHWEGDLMSFMKNSQHMLVLRERKTMFTLSTPLQNKKALDTAQAIISLLKDLPKKSRRSVTYDNGGEFAAHSNVFESIDVPAFFCDPYASWQKGGVENTNGRLRRDLPRKTNLKKMRSEDFNETIDNYNLTPRKNLGWLSPLEAFHKNLNRVAL